jgi:hypothetical protein
MRLIPSRPQMVISCARAKSLLRSLVRLVRPRSPSPPKFPFLASPLFLACFFVPADLLSRFHLLSQFRTFRRWTLTSRWSNTTLFLRTHNIPLPWPRASMTPQARATMTQHSQTRPRKQPRTPKRKANLLRESPSRRRHGHGRHHRHRLLPPHRPH